MSKPSPENPEEEFFIGWQGGTLPGISRFLRGRTALILAVSLMVAGVFPLLQRNAGEGRFQFGKVREFAGVLVAEPVPMLVTPEPEPDSGQSVLLLVRPLKHGFDRDLAARWNLEPIRLRGTLIHDGGNAMIEVVDGSVATDPNPEGRAELPDAAPLGKQSLEGEIVDSKCFLGVMNPGVLKPHRACAVNCIKGGIPPILLLRGADGRLTKLVLTGPGGSPINAAVLPYVAEPVEVTGEVSRRGNLLFLETDPSSGISRVTDGVSQ